MKKLHFDDLVYYTVNDHGNEEKTEVRIKDFELV